MTTDRTCEPQRNRKYKADAIWRHGATDEEIQWVEGVDREIAALEERRALLAEQRKRVTNRCAHRALYKWRTMA